MACKAVQQRRETLFALTKFSINIRRCMCEGGILQVQELITAVEQKLHIIVLLLNDNAYGMIKWKSVSLLPSA